MHYNVEYRLCSQNAHYIMKIYKYRKLGLVKAFAVILDINIILCIKIYCTLWMWLTIQ